MWYIVCIAYRLPRGAPRGANSERPDSREARMAITVPRLILLCGLIGLSGFVDSIAGGGGLISLPAYFIAGFPPHMATGTNKLSAFMGCSVATFNYARSGFIPWKTAAFSIAASLVGSMLGARISLMIGDFWFRLILMIVIPVVAYYVFRKKDGAMEREPYPELKTMLLCVPISFFVGMYDGFYGPGAGMFLILLYTGIAHLPLDKANGIAKAVNLASNVGSLIVFLSNGTTVVRIGLMAGACAMIGNYLGSTLFKRDGSRIVRPVMLVVLTIFFVKMITEMVGGA